MLHKVISYLKKPNLLQRLKKKIEKPFYFEQWALLVTRSHSHPISWNDFKLLTPPKDRFWADPFPWQDNGTNYIFYEELPFQTGKGHISCIKLDSNLEILSNEIVLKRPYHLSYPFLFDYEGQLYMLPETKENKTIELYRCKEFPDQWEHFRTIFPSIEAVDTTLHEYKGKWWMFVNVVEPGGNAYDSLYIFYAKSPIAEHWSAHPKNPVVRDIRRARPAGRIFMKDNILIRPSQDCSDRYGYAINFNQIEILSETDYKESFFSRFAPPSDNQYILGTHTWNETDDLRIIDAEYWQRK
ncbi:MAG: hypothetical protein J0M11_09650 [Anaerolineae bacterium]|nr:hypothetical protein [Anaerolineae bacterium]